MKVSKGLRFTHPHLIDPTWRPGPGQTYSQDGPHAECVVTAVRGGTVWYRYASSVSTAGVFTTTIEKIRSISGNH